MAHFGHAGPQFVKWLNDHKDCWEDLVEIYRLAIDEFSSMLPSDRSRIDVAVVTRLAQPAAALRVAAMVAHWALDLPWEVVDPLDTLWPEIVADTGGATGDQRALALVVSYAHSRRETFCGPSGSSGQAPAAGWSGRWDSGVTWEYIAFYPHVLKKMLAEFGFAPEAVLAGWKERGWLDVGRGRGFDKPTRVNGQNPCLIVVRREAIDAIQRES